MKEFILNHGHTILTIMAIIIFICVLCVVFPKNKKTIHIEGTPITTYLRKDGSFLIYRDSTLKMEPDSLGNVIYLK